MMYMPSLLNNLQDSFFDSFFEYPYGTARKSQPMMETDIKDDENSYELQISLPGIRKENIRAELKNGYLTIETSSEENTEKKDEGRRYIIRERYNGSMKRSFYVGKQLKEEDIHAKFENGILNIVIPKPQPKKEVPEEKKYIAIEG